MTKPDYVSPAFDDIGEFVKRQDPSATEGIVALYTCVAYALYCNDKKSYINEQLDFYSVDSQDATIRYSFKKFANPKKYADYYSRADQNLKSYLSIQLKAAITESVKDASISFRAELKEVETAFKSEVSKLDRGIFKEALFHIASVALTFLIPVVIIVALSIFKTESLVETAGTFADWLISIGNKIHQTIHQ